VTVVAADACGSLDTCAALATAVRRTDVTVLADAATGTFACNWRCAELASSAPRSHDALPSWLPQPKLNVGFRLAGSATRLTVASGTLPPVVQAVTVHSAACPRWMLDCEGCTATQRLTCPADVVEAARAAVLPDAGSVFVAGGLDVLDGEDFADVLVVVVCAAVDVLVAVSVAVADLVAVGGLVAVAVAVLVGVAVDLADALAVVLVVAVGFWDGPADGELLDDFRVSVVVLVGDLLAEELDVGVGVGE
jgi:hypothetical protein